MKISIKSEGGIIELPAAMDPELRLKVYPPPLLEKIRKIFEDRGKPLKAKKYDFLVKRLKLKKGGATMNFFNFDRKNVVDVERVQLLEMLAETPAAQAAIEARVKKVAARQRELVAEKKRLLDEFQKIHPDLEAEFATAMEELERAQAALKIAGEKHYAARVALYNAIERKDDAVARCDHELEKSADPLIDDVITKLNVIEELLMGRNVTSREVALLPGAERLAAADYQTKSAKLEILRTHVRPGLRSLKLEAVKTEELNTKIEKICAALLSE